MSKEATRREPLAPSPEVQHLPTLFRRIENGELRVPAFQRRFVWSEGQVLKLLESVYKGYPIGSLLLWRVDGPVLRVSDDPDLPFPDVEVTYPLSFVLDGMQRLSSLYGVMFWRGESAKSVFNVVFDLDERVFRHYEPSELPQAFLPLSVLSSPKRFLEATRALADKPNGDLLIDRSIELQTTFQEYMIPLVSITRREVGDVVEIFERINNSATRLSTIDFMRALTWSHEFDLNDRIGSLQADLSESGLDLDPETLVKLVAVALGIAPTPQAMLALRSREANELIQATERAKVALIRVATFLKSRFCILSSAYLPYEGQLLVLARAFLVQDELTTSTLSQLEKWFWRVSFSEGLRGKPDHYVTRFIANAEALAFNQTSSMNFRMDISPALFLERRFIRGAALSAAVASAWAVEGARSLVTGEVISPELYMQDFSMENYLPLLDLSQVRSALDRRVPSSRIIANTVLVSEADRFSLQGMNAVDILTHLHTEHPGVAEAVLRSQCLPPNSLELIAEDNWSTFLEARAGLLFAQAANLGA